MGTNKHGPKGLAVFLVILVAIAGCTGGAGGAAGGPDGRAETGNLAGGVAATSTPAPAATPAAEDGDSGGLRDGRVRIQTGRLEIEVEEFDSARQNVTEAVERYGGFVSDSHQSLHGANNETFTTGQLVLRVPAENFSALMDRLAAIGTVRERNTNSQDVTEQLVDIEARLNNLRAERDRLRELYARANDTESVLAVERRLSEVQTEIERLEARQQSLQRQVALSTITVELRETPPEGEEPAKWYEIGLLKAFLDSVDGVGVTLQALSVAFAYALPYLVVFGLPVAAIAVVVLRWRGRLTGGL